MSRIAILVTAAGSSSRFGGGNKLLQPLEGRPLLAWTMAVFEACPQVHDLYLTAPGADADTYRQLLAQVAPRTGRQVFIGGGERQDSIFLALQALASDPPDVMGVHDGARPLLTAELLTALLLAGTTHGAVPGHAPTDTIKRAEGGRVVQTLDRGTLVVVQTPQVFPWHLLWQAHLQGRAEGVVATDDAALVEHYGGMVMVVPGDRDNIKVTTPMDLWLVTRLLEGRKQNSPP